MACPYALWVSVVVTCVVVVVVVVVVVSFTQASESGVHRPHVSGIHGRDSEGAYSIVLAGGYEDDVVNAAIQNGGCSA